MMVMVCIFLHQLRTNSAVDTLVPELTVHLCCFGMLSYNADYENCNFFTSSTTTAIVGITDVSAAAAAAAAAAATTTTTHNHNFIIFLYCCYLLQGKFYY
jgi:hypothetical protein